jgi:hypothetical protein
MKRSERMKARRAGGPCDNDEEDDDVFLTQVGEEDSVTPTTLKDTQKMV